MIIVENVSKQFGKTRVLDGISTEIPLHKTTFVLGPSGHGKTVFLKTLIGLLKPEQGRIRFNGSDILAFSDRALYRFWADVGFVFQESALIDSLTVEENLSLFLTYQTEFVGERIRKKACDMLALVGLENMGKKFPEELSGGMKKRVAVARALAKDPPYLILDEPTTGIDEGNAGIVKKLIARLSREGDRTTIIATHDLRMMRELADFVLLIKNRNILFAGPAARLEETRLNDLYRTE